MEGGGAGVEKGDKYPAATYGVCQKRGEGNFGFEPYTNYGFSTDSYCYTVSQVSLYH